MENEKPGPPVSPEGKERAQRPERTSDLLQLARGGDRDALDRLCARFLPLLQRWASGRLPRFARDLFETEDLVQETVLHTFKRLEAFEPRSDGALMAYLRQAVVNRIRDEVRRVRRRGPTSEPASSEIDRQPSPVEEVIGREALERYESALQRLKPEDREAIIARVELGLSYAKVAEALGKSTEGAARAAVSRALVRLAEELTKR